MTTGRWNLSTSIAPLPCLVIPRAFLCRRSCAAWACARLHRHRRRAESPPVAALHRNRYDQLFLSCSSSRKAASTLPRRFRISSTTLSPIAVLTTCPIAASELATFCT